MRRGFAPWLALIVLAALALRGLLVWELAAHPALVDPPAGTDMAGYRRMALASEAPRVYSQQPGYYAVFLPLIHALGGRTTLAVMVAQALLGAATVWLCGSVAAQLFGRRAGLAAALLLACDGVHILFTPFLLMATLKGFLLALLAWLALRYRRRRSWARLTALGLTLGSAALVRGNVWLLTPALIWALPADRRGALGHGLALLLIAQLPGLPFAIHNTRALGRLCGPAAGSELVLALANNPQAPPGGVYSSETYRWWQREAEREVDRVPVSGRVLAWAAAEPLVVAELKLRTALLLLSGREVPNNVNPGYYARSSRVLAAPWPSWWLLWPLALLGLGAGRWRGSRRRLLWWLIALYAASFLPFYALSRFRAPLLPLLAIPAGAGLIALGRALASPRRRGPRVALWLACGVASSLAYDGYQRCCEPAAARWLRPAGLTVQLPDALLRYDHGPLASERVSARRFERLAPGGQTWRKAFAADPRARVPEGAQPLLRLAVQLSADAQVSLHVAGARRRDGARQVRDPNGFTWLEVPLEPLDPAASHELTLTLISTRGACWVAVDPSRDYRRSWTVVRRQARRLGAELAAQLVWRR